MWFLFVPRVSLSEMYNANAISFFLLKILYMKIKINNMTGVYCIVTQWVTFIFFHQFSFKQELKSGYKAHIIHSYFAFTFQDNVKVRNKWSSLHQCFQQSRIFWIIHYTTVDKIKQKFTMINNIVQRNFRI